MKSAVLIAILGVSLFAQGERRLQPVSASARRLALVIGNNAYAGTPLQNSVRDAQAVKASLEATGFTVRMELNTPQQKLEESIDAFVAGIRAGDVALFYYSGHGMQLDGENYLIPVDFKAGQEADVPYRAYSAGRVLEKLQASPASLNIVVLDACRDNPFRAQRGGTKGLAAMNTGKGSFVAFATSPGATASDNPSESNGLFTKYFLEALAEPGLQLGQAFDLVRERVYTASSGKQLPWTASSVIGGFVFRDAAVERARLEQELQDLERQTGEAEKRQAEQERQEKEQQAAAVRAKLNAQQPQAPATDPAATEKTLLAELRRKRDEQQERLASVSQGRLSLEEARKQATQLRQEIAGLEKDRGAAVSATPAGSTFQRDRFETSAEFEARQAKARAAREEEQKRIADGFEEAAKPLRERLATIRSQTYPVENATLELKDYDADAQQLTAQINGQLFVFRVPAAKAKLMFEGSARVGVEQQLDSGVVFLAIQTRRDSYVLRVPARLNPK